jgi:hypothetical protein
MIAARPLTYDSEHAFCELPDWEQDGRLREAVLACIEAQRAAARELLRTSYRPNSEALQAVSEEALIPLLRDGANINDIVERRELSNCITFNFACVQDAILDRRLARVRSHVDRLVVAKLRRCFRDGWRLGIGNSGNFWYPPGGFMGWHTNLSTPGWRLYINVVDEPGKSFFRYREPSTGEIITSWDRPWNFRFFRITPGRPLWHAIYSETNRFSLGYRVLSMPLMARIKRTAGSLVGA